MRKLILIDLLLVGLSVVAILGSLLPVVYVAFIAFPLLLAINVLFFSGAFQKKATSPLRTNIPKSYKLFAGAAAFGLGPIWFIATDSRIALSVQGIVEMAVPALCSLGFIFYGISAFRVESQNRKSRTFPSQ
jgi:hypothetical protein